MERSEAKERLVALLDIIPLNASDRNRVYGALDVLNDKDVATSKADLEDSVMVMQHVIDVAFRVKELAELREAVATLAEKPIPSIVEGRPPGSPKRNRRK